MNSRGPLLRAQAIIKQVHHHHLNKKESTGTLCSLFFCCFVFYKPEKA